MQRSLQPTVHAQYLNLKIASAVNMKRGEPDYNGGLPDGADAERMVLGCVLAGNAEFAAVQQTLAAEDFGLERHRLIFLRMKDLHARGVGIDRVTVAEELKRQKQLKSIDGLSYLASLDEGLPQIVKPDSYIRIVKEKAALRRIIHHSDAMAKRALLEGKRQTKRRVDRKSLGG